MYYFLITPSLPRLLRYLRHRLPYPRIKIYRRNSITPNFPIITLISIGHFPLPYPPPIIFTYFFFSQHFTPPPFYQSLFSPQSPSTHHIQYPVFHPHFPPTTTTTHNTIISLNPTYPLHHPHISPIIIHHHPHFLYPFHPFSPLPFLTTLFPPIFSHPQSLFPPFFPHFSHYFSHTKTP